MAATVEAAVPERHNSDKLSSEATSDQRRSLLSHLEDDEDKTVYAIMMPESYQMKQGVQLWQGVHLGKFLGAGMQAQVFQLARADGTPIGKVIKINHGDIGSKILNNNVLWIGMDREWEIGTQLRAALQEANGQVPGFMKVCDCLVRRRGNCAAFSGMLMEELHGWEVYKRIDTPEFHNIHYVREMLFQVFSALDRAQRKLGFHHADLGMRNIMEHYPTIWEQLPAEQGERAREEAKKRPGFTCTAGGGRLPLGPDIEFKIIDYGVAKFSSKLAAGAAGPEAQEIVDRLSETFGKRGKMQFGSEASPTALEMEQTDVTKADSVWGRFRAKWLPGANKLKVVIRPVTKGFNAAANRIRPSNSGASNVDTDIAPGEDEFQPVRLASPEQPSYTKAEGEVKDERRQLKGSKKRRKKKSPIEAMYRHFWHRKGDVFHLLLGMALALDDRAWPAEDEDDVAALCALVHHVTGIKMRARSAREDGSDLGRKKSVREWFRHWHIRAKGHILPFNSGLLAREALSHPFFGPAVVRHADLPIPLKTAFPPEGR